MELKDAIRTIPDFPKPGIMFRDVTTLMGNPRLILLDEPSLGLSPKLTKEIFEIVVRIDRKSVV